MLSATPKHIARLRRRVFVLGGELLKALNLTTQMTSPAIFVLDPPSGHILHTSLGHASCQPAMSRIRQSTHESHTIQWPARMQYRLLSLPQAYLRHIQRRTRPRRCKPQLRNPAKSTFRYLLMTVARMIARTSSARLTTSRPQMMTGPSLFCKCAQLLAPTITG